MTDYKENFKKISTFLLPKLPSKGRPFSGISTAFHPFLLPVLDRCRKSHANAFMTIAKIHNGANELMILHFSFSFFCWRAVAGNLLSQYFLLLFCLVLSSYCSQYEQSQVLSDLVVMLMSSIKQTFFLN